MVTMAGMLVLAAFMLTVAAVVVSVRRRRQVPAPGDLENQNAGRLDAATDASQIFAAAVAASQEVRRARLAREAKIRGTLTRVAFGLSGLIVIFALAARFLAGDREAATVCAVLAAISLGFTSTAYLSAKHPK